MSVNSQASSTAGSGLQTNESQMAEYLISTVQKLASDPTFKSISAFIDEKAKLNEQLESRNQRILDLKKTLEKQRKEKQNTYNEILEENHQQRNTIERRQQKIKSLEATVEEKQRTIAELREQIRAQATQINDLQNLHEEKQKKLERANEDISELEHNLEEKDKYINKLRVAGSELKKKHQTSLDDIKEMGEKIKSHEETIQENSERLQQLNGYIIPYTTDDDKTLVYKFGSIWASAWESLWVHFQEDLPMESLQHHGWKDLSYSLSSTTYLVPLPQSNSLEAKQMRLTIILAFLAREIDRNIFQPTYISADDNGIREILADLAMVDHEKESFCRGILLSIDPEKQTANLEKRKDIIIRNIESRLKNLFPRPQLDKVLGGVEVILQQASQTWELIQRSRDRYEPDFEPLEWDEFECDRLPKVNGADGNTEDEAVLTVLPRISRVKNNTRDALSCVTVLTRSQCLVAEQEQTELASPRNARAISDRQKSRRMSVQNKGFLANGNQSGEQRTK